MQLQLLLADSEVSRVEIHEHALQIHLSAANAEYLSTNAAAKPSSGYSKGILLRLRNYLLHERGEPLIGRINNGTLWIAGTIQRSCALPSTHSKPVKLELELANRSLLIVSATELSVTFERESNFHESLAC
jgi:hypothetical protein